MSEPALRATAIRADELGYDDIWTCDQRLIREVKPMLGAS
jgi:hypothetical protein